MGIKYWIFLALWLGKSSLQAQELFVFTEPASNMAAHSLALRLDNTVYHMDGSLGYTYRLAPELMWGAGRTLMIHFEGYAANVYPPGFRLEGGSVYAKYRFYAADEVHRHFRLAVYWKAALVNDPGSLVARSQGQTHTYIPDDIDLNGGNSGFMAGIAGTQLIHKVALSGSLAYAQRWDNGQGAHGIPGQSMCGLLYSVSGGFLLLPVHYKSYSQTNVNLMMEFLGANALDKEAAYIDAAPALQFIVNSISRVDLGFRTPIAGGMERLATGSFFIRLEYNFLNVYP